MKKKAELVLEKFPTIKGFAEGMNYDACLYRYKKYRLKDCQKSQYVKLRELEKIYSEDGVSGFIEAWLISLSEYFNISNDKGKLAGYQVEEIAMNILQDFGFLNIPELTILFRNIRKGMYFDIYGRISGAEIYQAVQEFTRERVRVIHEIGKQRAVANSVPMPIHERASLILKLLKNGIEKTKKI